MAVPRFNPFLDFLLHPHVGQIVSRPSSFQPFFFVFKTFDVGAIASPQQIGNSEDNIQFSSTNHIVVVVLHVTPVTTKCHTGGGRRIVYNFGNLDFSAILFLAPMQPENFLILKSATDIRKVKLIFQLGLHPLIFCSVTNVTSFLPGNFFSPADSFVCFLA